MALNQYDKGSKNNGPNAYKKGNRTPNQSRNGAGLAEISRRESAEIAKYKEIAEKQRKAKKYGAYYSTSSLQNAYKSAGSDQERAIIQARINYLTTYAKGY